MTGIHEINEDVVEEVERGEFAVQSLVKHVEAINDRSMSVGSVI